MRKAIVDPSIDSWHTDFRLANLHPRYPAYLCRPNLFWQSEHRDYSGLGDTYSNYYPNGTVKIEEGD
jgi:hypothetical protein